MISFPYRTGLLWWATAITTFFSNKTVLSSSGSIHRTLEDMSSVSKDGTLFSYQRLRDQDGNQIAYLNNINDNSRTCFTPEADLIVSYNNKIQIWKRAYRTKMVYPHNVIPQPAIRSISQRSGTNIIDLDFEIVDPDDANATVGILAAKKWTVHQPCVMDYTHGVGGWHRIKNWNSCHNEPGPPGIMECKRRLARSNWHPEV